MDNFRLAALTALWYAASLLFNLGMKRSHALIPDVLVLTTLQFCVGAVALGVAWGFNAVRGPEFSRQNALVCWSALLFFGGTLCTNVSLTLLSVSFAHVVKTLEPFFTVAIVYAWERTPPSCTSVLALALTAAGVLVATSVQRKSAGKDSAFSAGLAVALLANLFLQLRNVLNKRLMKGADDEAAESTPRPLELMLYTLALGLPLQLAVHAGADVVNALEPAPPAVSRYAHYGDAHPLWLLVTPLAFVAYQAASILVLAQVDPVMHAVLNACKRMVVIGLGAALMREVLSVGYAAGAAFAVAGVAAYSLAKGLSTSAAHTRAQLVLSVALFGVAAVAASGGVLGPPLPGGGAAAVVLRPPPPPPRQHGRANASLFASRKSHLRRPTSYKAGS